MGRNQIVGRIGEERVCRYLESQNIKLIEKNWRGRAGELDLIAIDSSGVIRFIEVKTRTSLKFGDPLEAINREKGIRLHKLAREWLVSNKSSNKFQIDCVSVLFINHDFVIDYREKVL